MQADVDLVEVTKRYGTVPAVQGVSLSVFRGEFLTILGPSGSGKTTLLRLVGGFERTTAGTVRIQGRTVTHDPPNLRNTSMVFQDYALFPHKTVAENIAFGLKMRGVPRPERERRVRDALELVNLPGVGDRLPHQLSGGQRQRVALARSLVVQPAVLLLDEPLGALDAQIRKRMQIELKALQRRLGITFLYVTHDQEEAMTVSDRVAILRDGVLEQVGPPDEVYDRPASRFVARFLGDCNLLDGAVREVDGRTVAVECLGLGRVRCASHHASVRPGDPVAVAIRPERLLLAPGPDGAANAVTARVAHVVYTGTTTRYSLRAGDTELVAVSLGRPLLSPGDDARASWRPEDAQIIVGAGA